MHQHSKSSEVLAEHGFDPWTSGLWAHCATPLYELFSIFEKWLTRSWKGFQLTTNPREGQTRHLTIIDTQNGCNAVGRFCIGKCNERAWPILETCTSENSRHRIHMSVTLILDCNLPDSTARRHRPMPPLGWLAPRTFVARTAAAKFKEQWEAMCTWI
jgi:hypothetical protein